MGRYRARRVAGIVLLSTLALWTDLLQAEAQAKKPAVEPCPDGMYRSSNTGQCEPVGGSAAPEEAPSCSKLRDGAEDGARLGRGISESRFIGGRSLAKRVLSLSRTPRAGSSMDGP
jgi:hypothetical protein